MVFGGLGWSKPVKIHGFWMFLGLRQLLWNRRKRLTKTWINTWEIVGYWCPSLGWKVAFPTRWISRVMLVGRYQSETWLSMGSSWNVQLSQSLYIIVRFVWQSHGLQFRNHSDQKHCQVDRLQQLSVSFACHTEKLFGFHWFQGHNKRFVGMSFGYWISWQWPTEKYGIS